MTQPFDLIFLLGSLIGFYISSRAAVDALDRGGTPSPVRQAIGHAIPIAAVAWGAAAMGQGQLAVAVLFSTAVAALTLVAALSILASPAGVGAEARGVWALVLPAALLAWLAGYAGQFLWISAAALLLEGIAIAAAWGEKRENEVVVSRPRGWTLRIIQLILAIVLAAIGVWMVLRTATYIFRETYFVTQGLFAATVVAPILVLPMIGSGVAQAQRGRLGTVLETQVAVVLLNLCLLLPLTAGVWWIFHRHQGLLAFPLGVWRIDNMGLIVLGLYLLCLTMRLWRAGKAQAGLLLLAYLVYLAMSLRAAVGG